ncbi:MAG: hypothetical protein EA401_07150 [Planctomycetota bacterium]|nr:MAG: hypothetical protein EA401_07150 [Planctomycetota bacterium]
MHSITEHAASTDTCCTNAIQNTIDHVHSQGGGTVLIPPGRWITGTLQLRSGVEIHLAHGAILQGSEQRADYREVAIAGEYGGSEGGFLIEANDCDNIAITGTGIIDGRGISFMDGFRSPEGPFIRKAQDWRPRGLGFTRCTRITLRDFTIRDAAQWTIHLTGCEDVLCHSLRILNRTDIPNNDGIDPDRCRRVRIIGCHIEAGDDCIVLKCTKDQPELGDCEDILIQGCTLISTSAALKIGTESHGNFRRIVATGCSICQSHRGLTIQLRDHGNVEDVIFADCTIETRHFHPLWWGQAEAISITATPRNDTTSVGSITGVHIHNILCNGENGVFIHGHPDAPIRDLSLHDVRICVGRSSRWQGGQHDLRPSGGEEHGGLYEAPCPALLLAHCVDSRIHDITVRWKDPIPEWASYAAEIIDCHHCRIGRINGDAAQSDLDPILER